MSRPFLASGISNGSFQDGPVVTVILISVGISHFLPVILPAPSRSQFSPLLVQVHVIHLQLPEVSSAAYNADQKERKKKKNYSEKESHGFRLLFPKFVLENEVTHAV